jgi:hypothetical protein
MGRKGGVGGWARIHSAESDFPHSRAGQRVGEICWAKNPEASQQGSLYRGLGRSAHYNAHSPSRSRNAKRLRKLHRTRMAPYFSTAHLQCDSARRVPRATRGAPLGKACKTATQLLWTRLIRRALLLKMAILGSFNKDQLGRNSVSGRHLVDVVYHENVDLYFLWFELQP